MNWLELLVTLSILHFRVTENENIQNNCLNLLALTLMGINMQSSKQKILMGLLRNSTEKKSTNAIYRILRKLSPSSMH